MTEPVVAQSLPRGTLREWGDFHKRKWWWLGWAILAIGLYFVSGWLTALAVAFCLAGSWPLSGGGFPFQAFSVTGRSIRTRAHKGVKHRAPLLGGDKQAAPPLGWDLSYLGIIGDDPRVVAYASAIHRKEDVFYLELFPRHGSTHMDEAARAAFNMASAGHINELARLGVTGFRFINAETPVDAVKAAEYVGTRLHMDVHGQVLNQHGERLFENLVHNAAEISRRTSDNHLLLALAMPREVAWNRSSVLPTIRDTELETMPIRRIIRTAQRLLERQGYRVVLHGPLDITAILRNMINPADAVATYSRLAENKLEHGNVLERSTIQASPWPDNVIVGIDWIQTDGTYHRLLTAKRFRHERVSPDYLDHLFDNDLVGGWISTTVMVELGPVAVRRYVKLQSRDLRILRLSNSGSLADPIKVAEANKSQEELEELSFTSGRALTAMVVRVSALSRKDLEVLTQEVIERYDAAGTVLKRVYMNDVQEEALVAALGLSPVRRT